MFKLDNKITRSEIFEIIKEAKYQQHSGKLAYINQSGNDIRVTCPCSSHAGGREKNADCFVYSGEDADDLKNGTWHCFACGAKGSLVSFIANVFDCSIADSKAWFLENFLFENCSDNLILQKIDLQKKKEEFLDDSVLDSFDSWHPYINQRKISRHIAEVFQIKYDANTKCIVFPVRNDSGKIVGLLRRSVDTKKFIIPPKMEKPIYLLHYIKKRGFDKCIITEGPIDALTSYEYGFPAIATLGNPSEKQISDLNKSGIRILYLMFDNDEAGKNFTKKILENLRPDILTIPVKIPKGKKDINDLSENEFWKCLNDAETNKNIVY